MSKVTSESVSSFFNFFFKVYLSLGGRGRERGRENRKQFLHHQHREGWFLLSLSPWLLDANFSLGLHMVFPPGVFGS